MNKEIDKILSEMCHIIWKYGDDFDDLEENEIRYQLPYKQMEKLYDYITNLQEENERLNNIINELENELYKFYAYEGYNDEQIKDKLQELKGSDKE